MYANSWQGSLTCMILSKKYCIFEAGYLDVLMSDISKMEAPCSSYKEGISSIDAMDDSLSDKVGIEHFFGDEATIQRIPVNDVTLTPLQEEPEDPELANLFMEGNSDNAALSPEVRMTQYKTKTRGLPTSKDLEKLEGIWKKVLCNT